MSGAGEHRRRSGRVVLVVVAVLIVVGAAGAAATGFGFGLGGGKNQESSSGLPPATARVTKETLVDTQTESGDLGYGDTTTLNGRLGGTVTSLPAPGTTIQRGQALYEVDDTPVVLLYGSLPAYRALSPGGEGADVKQFEQNLYALGYRGFTVDDQYSDSTATAVKKWQKDLGLPQTGTLDLGRVVYATGEVRVDADKASVGDAAGPGGALLTYTGTARVVTVKLDVTDERLAVKDAAVTVELPDGKTVAGKIATTQTVIDTGGDNGSDPTTKIEVTVAIDDENALAGLDQAVMDVRFAASQRDNVLSVPVAALLALAEGGYGVQEVTGTTTRIVPVQTGLFAAGRVEISGAGVTEGMTVGVPS
jgi:peptidoglycan hydrolase-like protein with peptidoglycan-binding domain